MRVRCRAVLGQRFVRPLTGLVIALGVVTAATSATAVVVALRGDDATTAPAAEVRSIDTMALPTLNTDLPVTTAASVPPTEGNPSGASVGPPSTARSAGTPRPCAQLQALPTRAKLAQLLFVGVSDAATARTTLSGPNPAGGILVLGKGSTWFANGVLKGIAGNAIVPPVVAADEEGGRVQRIDAIYGSMPSAYEMGRMPVAKVRDIAKKRGDQLRDLGFTMDLAPVVDVYDKENAVINDRAFDADPKKVIASAGAFAEGLNQARIAPVLKHFPGHGRSTGDSHKESVETPPLAELRKTDLVPFGAMASAVPAIMVGHLDVPGLTAPGRPASVSKEAINGLLRKEMGFNGLVITDDLSGMKAITDRFTVPEAVVASISVGADIAIIALGPGQTLAPMLNALEGAVKAGELSMARVDEALARLGAFKPGCR